MEVNILTVFLDESFFFTWGQAGFSSSFGHIFSLLSFPPKMSLTLAAFTSHFWAVGVCFTVRPSPTFWCTGASVLTVVFFFFFANMTLFPEKARVWGFNHEPFILLVSHILMMPESLLGSSALGRLWRKSGGMEKHLQHELRNVIEGFQLLSI